MRYALKHEPIIVRCAPTKRMTGQSLLHERSKGGLIHIAYEGGAATIQGLAAVQKHLTELFCHGKSRYIFIQSLSIYVRERMNLEEQSATL